MDENGQTPLHQAAQRGFINLVKALLEQGVDIDQKDKAGKTALFLAAESIHLDVAKELLDRGADASARNNRGWTPLHIIINMFDYIMNKPDVDEGERAKEFITMLLDYGANPVSYDDYDEDTPLHLAAQASCVEAVEVGSELIKRGALIEKKNRSGCTPLHTAVQFASIEFLQMLLEQEANPNARIECSSALMDQSLNGMTPLHSAVVRECPEKVIILLEKGANVNEMTESGWTPLDMTWYSFNRGGTQIARLLLEHGADPLISCEEWTPLFKAVEVGCLELVKMLLERGVDVDENKDRHCNETPLHMAISKDYEQIALILLENGASPRFEDRDGKTLLHLAAEKGCIEVGKELIKRGAEVDVQETHWLKETPLHSALRASRRRLCKTDNPKDEKFEKFALMLLERGANPLNRTGDGQTSLHLAAQMGYVETAKGLLKKGVKIDEKNNGDSSPLHVALIHNQDELALFLLTRGADPELQASNGWTPLHVAAYSGFLEGVKALLKRHVQIDQIDNLGMTPLMLATKNYHLEVVKELLKWGANMYIKDQNELTVLKMAISKVEENALNRLDKPLSDHLPWSNYARALVRYAFENGREIAIFLYKQHELNVPLFDEEDERFLGLFWVGKLMNHSGAPPETFSLDA